MKNPHKTFLTLGIIVSALILFFVIPNNKNETGIFNIAYAIISLALIVFLVIGMKYNNKPINFIILFLSVVGLNPIALVSTLLGLSSLKKNENIKDNSLDEILYTSKSVRLLFIISTILSIIILSVSSFFIFKYIPSEMKNTIDNIKEKNPYFPIIEILFIFLVTITVYSFPFIIEAYSIYLSLTSLIQGKRRKFMTIVPVGIFSLSILNTIGALIVLNKTKFNECDEKMQN